MTDDESDRVIDIVLKLRAFLVPLIEAAETDSLKRLQLSDAVLGRFVASYCGARRKISPQFLEHFTAYLVETVPLLEAGKALAEEETKH